MDDTQAFRVLCCREEGEMEDFGIGWYADAVKIEATIKPRLFSICRQRARVGSITIWRAVAGKGTRITTPEVFRGDSRRIRGKLT